MPKKNLKQNKNTAFYFLIVAIILLLLGIFCSVQIYSLKQAKVMAIKSSVVHSNDRIREQLISVNESKGALEKRVEKITEGGNYFLFILDKTGKITATTDNLMLNQPMTALEKVVPGVTQQLALFLKSDQSSKVILTHDVKTDFFLSFSFLHFGRDNRTLILIRNHASQKYFVYIHKIQHLLTFTLLFFGLALFFILFSFDKFRKIDSKKSRYVLVVLFSTIFIVLIVTIISWRTPPTLSSSSTIIYQKKQIHELIQVTAKKLNLAEKELLKIPFGVYITNLSFNDTNSVTLSLWLWRKLPNLNNKVKVLLPQKIKGSAEVTETGKDSIFWRYNTLQLQQLYPEMRYPFDDRYVSIQFWHTDVFNPKILMYPDVASYDIASKDNIVTPQLDPNLKVKHWDVLDSFYVSNNFQVGARMGKPTKLISSLPRQISMLVLLRRDFTAPFMKYYLPLIIILMMYFIGLITSEKSKDESDVFKILTYNASLLFVVTVAANAAREQITTNKISFIEVSYIILYVVIVSFSIMQYIKAKIYEKHPIVGDKLQNILQIGYWPLTLGAFLLTTIHYFW